VAFYGFATYGNAGYMREQVCKYMCPYARFQSAMFDKDTMIVSYDAERGEARGPRKKDVDYKAQGLGTASIASFAFRSAPWASISAKGCSTSALAAVCASMPATP
jgi:polyferredoxin